MQFHGASPRAGIPFADSRPYGREPTCHAWVNGEVAQYHLPPLPRLRPELPHGNFPLRRCTFNTTTDEDGSEIRTCGSGSPRLALRSSVAPVTTGADFQCTPGLAARQHLESASTFDTRLTLRPGSLSGQLRQRFHATPPCGRAAFHADTPAPSARLPLRDDSATGQRCVSLGHAFLAVRRVGG